VRAFVIRGFGEQAGIDFERVHEELIGPALADVGIDDGGTAEIVEAGSVREDIFRELYLADIVVADVSVPNANVFYELGIRHAVRPRTTVLISARIDEIPFDLRADRYLRYDPDSPGGSVSQLAQVLPGAAPLACFASSVYCTALASGEFADSSTASLPCTARAAPAARGVSDTARPRRWRNRRRERELAHDM